MKEKLLVDFEVENTIDREYGYQEKLLRYNGAGVRYKGIVKGDKLVAILGRNYKLITNEEVGGAIQTISVDNHYRREGRIDGWKTFNELWSSDGNVGVLVTNSVDGTIALKCIAMINISGVKGILVSVSIQNILRKHTKQLDVSVLKEEITEIMGHAYKYREWLQKMAGYKIRDNAEVLKMLFEKLPNAYTKGLHTMLEFKTFGEPTVKDVYQSIAKKIWSSDTKMVTKLHYYRALNDVVFVICGL